MTEDDEYGDTVIMLGSSLCIAVPSILIAMSNTSWWITFGVLVVLSGLSVLLIRSEIGRRYFGRMK